MFVFYSRPSPSLRFSSIPFHSLRFPCPVLSSPVSLNRNLPPCASLSGCPATDRFHKNGLLETQRVSALPVIPELPSPNLSWQGNGKRASMSSAVGHIDPNVQALPQKRTQDKKKYWNRCLVASLGLCVCSVCALCVFFSYLVCLAKKQN